MKKINISPIIFGVFVILFGGFIYFNYESSFLHLITGLVLGYVLVRSSFGFMAAIKIPYATGRSNMTRALLVAFLTTIILMGAVHYSSISSGGVPSFRAVEGDLVIPGSGSVDYIDGIKILGGILFGAGMAMGEGCASGLFRSIGAGNLSGYVVLTFFGIGGILSQPIIYDYNNSSLSTPIIDNIYLPDYFGIGGSILLSAALIGILYLIIIKYESARSKYPDYTPEAPIEPTNYDGELTTDKIIYNLFLKPWPRVVGGLLLSGIFVSIVLTTGKSWGVSTAYNYMAFWVADKLGIVFNHPGYQAHLEVARAGILNSGSVLRNIGSVLGVTFYLLSVRKFKFKNNIRDFKHLLTLILGGLLMGLGARMGRGCNIGSVYAGVANFGLSGWISLVLNVLSAIITLRVLDRLMAKKE